MEKNRKCNLILLISLGLIYVPQFASGIGYEIGEQDAKATALAGAFTAWADNPSAIYYNTAGVALADKPEVSLGLTMIYPQARLVNDGNREKNRADSFYVPNFFFTTPLGKHDLSFGLGVYSPYGLATEWDRNSIAKYAGIKSTIETIFITPVLAWKPIPEISVGAGVSYIYSETEMTSKFPFSIISGGLTDDAFVRLQGKDHNWGWTAGILAKPTDKLNLGFSYRSQTILKYKGTLDVEGIDPMFQPLAASSGSNFHTDVSANLPLPHRYSMGIAYKFLPNFKMEFDYERVLWSALKNQDIHLDKENIFFTDTHTKKDWRDTNAFKLGAELMVTDSLALRAGGFYEETAVPDSTLDPTLPESERFGYSLGAGYVIGSFSMNLALWEGFSKPRSVKNDSLEANDDTVLKPAGQTPGRDRYENHVIEVLLNLSYRF